MLFTYISAHALYASVHVLHGCEHGNLLCIDPPPWIKKILYSVDQGNLSVLNTVVLPLNILTRCSSLVTIG